MGAARKRREHKARRRLSSMKDPVQRASSQDEVTGLRDPVLAELVSRLVEVYRP